MKIAMLHPGVLALYGLLLMVGFLCTAPFVYILSISVSSEEALATHGATLLPSSFTLDAYRFLFTNGDRLFRSFGVSIFLATVGTALNVLVTAMLAYPLSRKYLPYRITVMKGIFFTMLFSGGLIPTYLLVLSIGLYDSVWALIIPGLINSWNLILMRNFFMTIPDSLEESALIDGANELQVFLRIILPTSKTIIATIALFYAVAHWNSWFGALMYISDLNKWPAMLFLRQILANLNNPANIVMTSPIATKPPTEPLRMACVVVLTVPILLSYPFAQKYFVKGVMLGSIKG
ncbi:carbohydrate ABC transporter permease [Paenibacillus sp.]|uniref:carbohydrate ABC transporter permease n=1 Tax=Paenibacillus sp. TaxID=58172 RepID=UPI002D3F1D6F|nr:carbohydrate ABC transporter permease [Paenibacillus sp.]HZG58100.1 carbohydrate ABC transporter permease [Paenibacillus sp.]